MAIPAGQSSVAGRLAFIVSSVSQCGSHARVAPRRCWTDSTAKVLSDRPDCPAKSSDVWAMDEQPKPDVDERYDDGGFTGANTDRAAFQRLMADIDAGKVDVIVVYKVDRLSRSLLDFVKVMERLGTADASFVSVTQNFSTADAMGRLTMNLLASFAEFERSMIAERTRDKIAASRRKGKWTGGPVPFGYSAKDKKLVVNEVEARVVREAFALFLQHRQMAKVARELNERGLLPRGSSRPSRLGLRWTKDSIARVLRSPLYAGLMMYGDELHPGEQPRIIDDATYRQATRILEDERRELRFTGLNRLRAARAPALHPVRPGHVSRVDLEERQDLSLLPVLDARQAWQGRLLRASAACPGARGVRRRAHHRGNRRRQARAAHRAIAPCSHRGAAGIARGHPRRLAGQGGERAAGSEEARARGRVGRCRWAVGRGGLRRATRLDLRLRGLAFATVSTATVGVAGGGSLHHLADVAEATAALRVLPLAVVSARLAFGLDGRLDRGRPVLRDIGLDVGDRVLEAEAHQALRVLALVEGDATRLAEDDHLAVAEVHDLARL